MATYEELAEIRSNATFRNKVAVAVVVKAQAIIDNGASTQAEVAWAAESLASPKSRSEELVNYVLAANKSASTATILGADDANIQTNVNTAVDALIAGGV